MVCPEHRWAFAGVERADSLVVNAHKWMLTPNDCSLLWTRRPEEFRRAFSLIPEYLRTPDAEDALSLSEYGPALGRRFRALKLWAVLRCHGRSGLQEHIRRGIGLAAMFERWIAEEAGWELSAPRPFSVVCFRLQGADERNRELLTADYAAALAAAGACHCLNVHPRMPDVRVQAHLAGVADSPMTATTATPPMTPIRPTTPTPMTIGRWLLGAGAEYEAASRRFAPFNRLAAPDPGARRALAEVAREALAAGRPFLLTVNNNAEGCAPLSILALARELAARS